jgi:hypothetical protein
MSVTASSGTSGFQYWSSLIGVAGEIEDARHNV